MWFLFNVLGKSRRPEGRTRPPPPTPRTGLGDATQREGSQLEALFRELERRLEEAAAKPGPVGRPARIPLPPAEEVEERGSLETGAEVVSLEEVTRRPSRPRVDRDEEVERIEAARIAEAEARSGPLAKADHTVFDVRIRQEPADATAVRPRSPEELRRAVIWREILGPPASLRDPER
jgi:hypothetical protein